MPHHDVDERSARLHAGFDLLARVGLAGAALACLALAPVLTRAALRLVRAPELPPPGAGVLPGVPGDLLLGAAALGALALAAWRYAVALWDPERRGAGWGGLARRAGALLEAVAAAAAGAAAFTAIVGWGGPPAPRGGLERADRFMDAILQGVPGVAPSGALALLLLGALALLALGVWSASRAARGPGRPAARRGAGAGAREPARTR